MARSSSVSRGITKFQLVSVLQPDTVGVDEVRINTFSPSGLLIFNFLIVTFVREVPAKLFALIRKIPKADNVILMMFIFLCFSCGYNAQLSGRPTGRSRLERFVICYDPDQTYYRQGLLDTQYYTLKTLPK